MASGMVESRHREEVTAKRLVGKLINSDTRARSASSRS